MDDPREGGGGGRDRKRAKKISDRGAGVTIGNYDDDPVLARLSPKEYPYKTFLDRVRYYEALLEMDHF